MIWYLVWSGHYSPKCLEFNVQTRYGKSMGPVNWCWCCSIFKLGWLNVNVKDIGIEDYNVYRSDRPKKGGGDAIYTKCKFSFVLSQSVSKQFEFLALSVNFSKKHYQGGWLLQTLHLQQVIEQLCCQIYYHKLWTKMKLIVIWTGIGSGLCQMLSNSNVTLNRWLTPVQRQNPKCPEKSTLLDDDVSEHCLMAAVRDSKVP